MLTTRSTSFAVASCGGLVVQLRCVRGVRRSDGFIDGPAPHADAHQRRNSRLLHGDAVNGVGRFGGGARVVRDDDELRSVLEPIQHANEMADVLIIERSIDFVKQAEGARLGEKDSE
jgi:hypothetical protein